MSDMEDEGYDKVRDVVGENRYYEYYEFPEKPVRRYPFGFQAPVPETPPQPRRTMKTKTANERVLKALGKKGKTAITISTQANVAYSTALTILGGLVRAGQAQIVGTKKLNPTGRPSNLYAL